MLKAGTSKDLATLEHEIDADLSPRSVELKGWRAAGETNVIEKKTQIKNVVAVLDGQGPLADETIVIGAHYDHLGLGGAGSLALDHRDSQRRGRQCFRHRHASGGRPSPGNERRRPRRRIVFIAFTGEERGLLGSTITSASRDFRWKRRSPCSISTWSAA